MQFGVSITVAGAVSASQTRGLHVTACDKSRAEQSFRYDNTTGYVSVISDGVEHCAVVSGCGLGQDAPVVLVPCESTNSSCASWNLVIPAHVYPSTPDAQWLVAPGSPDGQPHCLENPSGSTVDIYCCSGSNNCGSTWSTAIPHQQWQLNDGQLKLATGTCLEAAPSPLTEVSVWPLPAHLVCSGRAAGPSISSKLAVSLSSKSEVVKAAGERYQKLLQGVGSESGGVKTVVVSVESDDEELGLGTDYSYSLSLDAATNVVSVHAASPYGVPYAFESLLQLQEQHCVSFDLNDAPVFPHRGLMIDTGRRFYPMALLESILEGMAMYKMNVLHFHLSEECFRVESKVHPGLHTADCTVRGLSNNEYYTQEDIAHIVQFAKLRGIRVVPEFDMPGHSGGFCKGLESEGIQCCGSQIEDDSDGKGVQLINSILEEMMGLFPDAVMHIGCDETGSKAPCTLNNTKSFEEKVIDFLLDKNKTVMGWEEILFKTGAAERSTDIVVDAWARSSWQQAAKKGHPAVDSANGHFYLDNLGHDHAAAGMWLDIYKGESNTTLRSLLLGGEASMWQDQYVPNRVASCMFQSPDRDDDFSNSTSSMIWPRSAIAAGSFWRYSDALSGTDALFSTVLSTASGRLSARGIGSCSCTTATSTGCKQQSYCGVSWCDSETLIA